MVSSRSISVKTRELGKHSIVTRRVHDGRAHRFRNANMTNFPREEAGASSQRVAEESRDRGHMKRDSDSLRRTRRVDSR